ncbi:hypothetical protein BDY21DRAFT_30287 [Lineolata rhizophorae]|uniref:Zn(2)-C6 fungal-type domain-containing protein n=1 Tax=Lineolata rhizophorae TaxID=578093 RepID=A0A6A6P2G0_9PEZI|nr:hypothetical protein BDY21DRAFT_30287 [Lineolata rhizophorae]
MLPSPQSSETQSTKPIKLRTACNPCNAAKVKCSGEKTGCERCRNLDGVQCIYTESRVGKVPGARAKKRKLQDGANSSRHVVPYSVSPSSSGHVRTPIHPAVVDSTEAVLNWTGDYHHPLEGSELVALDGAPVIFDEQGRPISNVKDPLYRGFSSIPGEYLMPSTDFGIDGFVESPVAMSSSRITPPLGAVSPASSPTSCLSQRSDIDSHCVLACAQVVISLENYILADVKVLGIILGVVRKAVDRLSELVNMQQGTRNSRFLDQLNVILNQIIDLFERGCSSFLDEDYTMQHSSLSDQLNVQSMSSCIPGFALGGFHAGRQEQCAWRAHVIQKEIQHARELLHQMRILITWSPPENACENQARELCYDNFDMRLRDLSERVGQRKAEFCQT